MGEGKKEVAAALVPLSESQQVGELFRRAIDKGMDVAGLEKLVTLHERVADRAAAQEFADALAAFQAECPPIPKASRAEITTKSGVRYSYNFADLDLIVKTVRPVLYQHGLSFSWKSKANGTKIESICILRHVNGHNEESSFECPTGSSAGMSEAQKVASGNTFARRQSLVQILGLTTTEPDADGARIGTMITDGQVADLEAMIEEVKADRARFLKFLGVADLAALPVTRFASAVSALEAKRRSL